jgi:dTDP-4-dehydrorhamnose reductase
MRRLLVTGATGFIGSHLVYRARLHWRVYGTFHTQQNAPSGVEMIPFDLAKDNPSILLETADVSRVVHTAAIARTEDCHRDPERAHQVNVKGTERLAAACAARKIPFFFLSTDMVFDGTNPPYSEESTPNPQTVYGQTKLEAEGAILKRIPDVTIIRANLVYGKGLGFSTSHSQIVLHTLENQGSVTLFEDQFRSPVSVRNLTNVLMEMLEDPPCRLIHISGPDRVSRVEFGRAVAKSNDIDPNKVHGNRMADHPSEITYPVDTSFDISLATSSINTRLLGVDEGLNLEYRTEAEEWIGKA